MCPGIGIGIGTPFGNKAPFIFLPAEAPSGLTATTISDTRIDLACTSNSGGIEDGFSWERSTDGITYAEIGTTLTGIVAYSDTTCIAGTLYYYRVRAYVGTTYSDYSNVDSDRTLPLLDTWHKEISDDIILDETENTEPIFATVLPIINTFNGTDDYYNTEIVFKTGSTFVVEVYGRFTSTTVPAHQENGIYNINGSYAGFGVIGGNFVSYRTAADYVLNPVTAADTNWHTFKLDTANGYYIDNVQLYAGAYTLGATGGNFYIGAWNRSTIAYSAFQIQYCKIWVNGVLTRHYIPSKSTGFVYDITGNHVATYTGTGAHNAYSIYGNPNLLQDGYSLWEKALSADIHVPLKNDSTPLSLVAGTNIPAGYTKTRDLTGGAETLNMADCLIDFGYSNGLYDSFKACDDTDGSGHNLANCGLGYDYANDYLIIGEFCDATRSRLLVKNKANVLINTIDVTTLIDYIQGVTYDNAGTYYIWGITKGAAYNENNGIIIGVDSLGNQVFTHAVASSNGAPNAALHYETGGYLWLRHLQATGTDPSFLIRKYRISDWAAITTKPNPVIGEGLWINADGSYYLGRSGGINYYNAADALVQSNTIAILPQNEDLIVDKYGVLWHNRDTWYHGSVVNGNIVDGFHTTVLRGDYIFNRANTTFHAAASRAAADYDSNNPLRWNIANIADYAIYSTYFNAAYVDKVFSKIAKSGADIIRLDEVLNCNVQQTGAGLIAVKAYCGI